MVKTKVIKIRTRANEEETAAAAEKIEKKLVEIGREVLHAYSVATDGFVIDTIIVRTTK